MFEIETNKNLRAGEKIFWLEGPAQYIASKESQSNISSNQFNWDSSQINVLPKHICRNVSLNTFRNSLIEFGHAAE